MPNRASENHDSYSLRESRDPRDRAAEIIRSGDAGAVLKLAVDAMMAAANGRFCTCEEPILHGQDLMCGACLLENESQRELREKRMREPHAFEPSGEDRIRVRFCRVCARIDTDERHRV